MNKNRRGGPNRNQGHSTKTMRIPAAIVAVGLSAILTGYRLCRDTNGTYVLTSVQDHVRKLISISQLDNMLTVLPTISEAVDYIFMEEVEKQLHKES